MVKRARRVLLLTTSVALIVVLGLVAAWGHLTTARRVDAVQRADRVRLQGTLGGLTNQYLEFTFLDTLRAAEGVRWVLRPDAPADRAALERAVRSSHLTSYGATLTTATGVPLTSYAPAGLPSPLNAGWSPLRAALLSGRPGLSDVMHVKAGLDVVAFAVPVRRSGSVAGLLIVYADVETWPLQGYDTTLRIGTSATPYVVDAHGTVAAAGAQGAVGRTLSWLPARVLAGGSGVGTFSHGGHALVVSYAPAGHGWTGVTVQDRSAFTAGLQARSERDALAIVALLVLVALLLTWFAHTRHRALRRLADERLFDPLTGLAQRRLFDFRLDAALARQRRSRAPLAVLFCDLDDFKSVNDTFGHNAGDQLLRVVGDRLRHSVRDDDFIARLGGDEFALIIEGSEPREVREVMSRLRAVVGQQVTLGATVMHPRVSVGAAVVRDASRAGDLLAEADLAMYRVKRGGTSDGLVVLDPLGVQLPGPRNEHADTNVVVEDRYPT